MNPNEYQRLAARTECDYLQSMNRMNPNSKPIVIIGAPIRLNHSVLGLTGEVGELAGAIEKWIYYGQQRDDTNIKEELGDCLWYIALACNTLGISLADVMEANINKLKLRYPEKFSEELAKEENRDREGEREIVKSKYPWFTPVLDPITCKCTCKLSDPCPLDKIGPNLSSITRCSDLELASAKVKFKWLDPKEPLTQTGSGFAEPPDDSIPIIKDPVVSFGDGLKRVTDSSYDRFCSVCKVNPIHRSNEAGVCPSCRAKAQNEDYLRRTRDA